MGRKTVSCNGVEATLSSSEEGPRRARRHERRRPVRGRLVGDKPSRRPRRVGPRRRRGRAELPSPQSAPASPSRTGLAQSTRWPARLLLRIHRVAAQRLCGVPDVVLAVIDSGHRVDFRVRRHRGHGAHGGDEIVDAYGVVAESLRQPPCGRTLTGARRSTEP